MCNVYGSRQQSITTPPYLAKLCSPYNRNIAQRVCSSCVMSLARFQPPTRRLSAVWAWAQSPGTNLINVRCTECVCLSPKLKTCINHVLRLPQPMCDLFLHQFLVTTTTEPRPTTPPVPKLSRTARGMADSDHAAARAILMVWLPNNPFRVPFKQPLFSCL